MWTKLLQLWHLIQPYVDNADWNAFIAAFEQAAKDFTGGNVNQVITDLVKALKALFPTLPIQIQDAMDHIASS